MDQADPNSSAFYQPSVYEDLNLSVLSQPVSITVSSEAITEAMRLSSNRRRRRNVKLRLTDSQNRTSEAFNETQRVSSVPVRVVFLAYRTSTNLFPSDETADWVNLLTYVFTISVGVFLRRCFS